MTINSETLKFSKLSKQFLRANFSSGKEHLDDYIQKFALKNQKRGLGVTWVLHENNGDEIIGYYTLVTAQVNKATLPNEYGIKLPNFPIPCQLIAKLAVDSKFQKLGYGGFILHAVLTKSREISEEIGCYAVIVDALDEEAKKFYLKYSFETFIDDGFRLFLPIKSIPSNK